MCVGKADADVKAVLVEGEADLANRIGGLGVQFGDELGQFLPAVGLGQLVQQGVDETAGGCAVPFAPPVAADRYLMSGMDFDQRLAAVDAEILQEGLEVTLEMCFVKGILQIHDPGVAEVAGIELDGGTPGEGGVDECGGCSLVAVGGFQVLGEQVSGIGEQIDLRVAGDGNRIAQEGGIEKRGEAAAAGAIEDHAFDR